MAETWVINESPSITFVLHNINFTSNSILFDRIEIVTGDTPYPPLPGKDIGINYLMGSTICYNTYYGGPLPDPPLDRWLDTAYRTVTFDESPTGGLLTWLEANAVKQEPLVTDDLTGWTWVGNETLSDNTNTTYSINFESNAETFSSIGFASEYGFLTRVQYDHINKWRDDFGWADDAYKTIQITGGTDATNTDLIKWLQDNGTLSPTPAPEPVDVSNKTFFIKDVPSFSAEATIHGNFTSGDQDFTQISVLDYEGDWELWYIDASANSVLAYSNGVWEIEYRYLTFEDGETLAASEYDAFIDLYEEYTPAPTPYTLTVTYNGTNIFTDTITEGVTVVYGGSILATLPEGTTTLACAGTLMENDVVLTAGLDTLVTLNCHGKLMATDVVMTLAELQAWDTPTISLSDSIVSTPIVEGVTKYKVYDNSTYIGYVDDENVWHGGEE